MGYPTWAGYIIFLGTPTSMLTGPWKKQHLCTWIKLFAHFFSFSARSTSTSKYFISRFVENVNTRRRLSFCFPELRNSLLEFNSRKNGQKVVELIVWEVICPQSHFSSDVKARLKRRTFHKPNLIHWIKYMKSSASESIRNACFNLERLSRSLRLAWPGISPLERLRRVWFRHRTFHVPNLMHKLL